MNAMTLPLIAAGKDLGPPPVVHQLVQERALRPVFNDHYLLGAFTDTMKLRARIAGFFLPTRGVVAAESALWVYLGGLRPNYFTALLTPGSSAPPRSSGIRVIRTALDPTSIAGIEGVPITTKDRTIADLARWCDPDLARAGIIKLIRLGGELAQARKLIPARGRNCVTAHDVLNSAARELANSVQAN